MLNFPGCRLWFSGYEDLGCFLILLFFKSMNVDPIWGELKADLLEAVWVPNLVFAPSEVAKPFPPSELVLVCWWSFGVECFHFDSVGALGVMATFTSRAGMCFFARCGKHYWLSFCCISIWQEKYFLQGVFHNCNYVSNCLLQIIFCGCFWERK